MKLNFIFILLIHSALAGNLLLPNDKLEVGQQLITNNKYQNLILQPDGNLVMYRNGIARWASGTKDSGAKVAKMQPDGNFVLYDAQNQAKWSTGTHGNPDSYLWLKDDGNLYIYDTFGFVKWSADTARNRMNSGEELKTNDELRASNDCQGLKMQPDGNLVMYWNGIARWASGTKDSGATVAKMQPDGNFVLYNEKNEAKWSTGTHGNPGAYLVLQDDGNLVLYSNSTGSAKWNSNTKKGSEPYYDNFSKYCCRGDDGHGRGVRQYTAILRAISGDWETACKNTPINFNGQFFCQASDCIKYISMYGGVKIPDRECDIDQDWLKNELRNVVGKTFVCDWSNWKSDGCSNPVHSDVMASYNNMFHKACVFHDYCYASPWNGDSSGKKKCDDRFYSLLFDDIPWYNWPAMAMAGIYVEAIKGKDGENSYNKGQNAVATGRAKCRLV